MVYYLKDTKPSQWWFLHLMVSLRWDTRKRNLKKFFAKVEADCPVPSWATWSS